MNDAEPQTEELRYESNPKHRDPWQAGQRGSLCPKEIKLDAARRLLKESILHEGHRYAVCEGQAFKGQCDKGVWHGYPVGWVEVPETVRQRFVKEGRMSSRDMTRNWRAEKHAR